MAQVVDEDNDRGDFTEGNSLCDRSREASGELVPMEDVRPCRRMRITITKRMKSWNLFLSQQQNLATLSDWTSKNDSIVGTGSSNYGELTSEASAPIPESSLLDPQLQPSRIQSGL